MVQNPAFRCLPVVTCMSPERNVFNVDRKGIAYYERQGNR